VSGEDERFLIFIELRNNISELLLRIIEKKGLVVSRSYFVHSLGKMLYLEKHFPTQKEYQIRFGVGEGVQVYARGTVPELTGVIMSRFHILRTKIARRSRKKHHRYLYTFERMPQPLSGAATNEMMKEIYKAWYQPEICTEVKIDGDKAPQQIGTALYPRVTTYADYLAALTYIDKLRAQDLASYFGIEEIYPFSFSPKCLGNIANAPVARMTAQTHELGKCMESLNKAEQNVGTPSIDPGRFIHCIVKQMAKYGLKPEFKVETPSFDFEELYNQYRNNNKASGIMEVDAPGTTENVEYLGEHIQIKNKIRGQKSTFAYMVAKEISEFYKKLLYLIDEKTPEKDLPHNIVYKRMMVNFKQEFLCMCDYVDFQKEYTEEEILKVINKFQNKCRVFFIDNFYDVVINSHLFYPMMKFTYGGATQIGVNVVGGSMVEMFTQLLCDPVREPILAAVYREFPEFIEREYADLDWSSYDSRIVYFFLVAIACVAAAYFKQDKGDEFAATMYLISRSAEDFAQKTVYIPEFRTNYVMAGYMPSGSFMTSVIDSLIQEVLYIYFLDELMDKAKSESNFSYTISYRQFTNIT
jgi:hypothetical protein